MTDTILLLLLIKVLFLSDSVLNIQTSKMYPFSFRLFSLLAESL